MAMRMDDVVSSLFVAALHRDAERWKREVGAAKEHFCEDDCRTIRAEVDEAVARFKSNSVPIGQRIAQPWEQCESHPGFYRIGGVVDSARACIHPATEAERARRRAEDRSAYRLSVCEADMALSEARLSECIQSGDLVAVREEEAVLSGYRDKHVKLSHRVSNPPADPLPPLTLKEQRERKGVERQERVRWAQRR